MSMTTTIVDAAPDAPRIDAPQTEEALGSPVDAAVDAITIGQQEALQSMEAAGATVLEGLTQVQRELADFVSERIRQDMETQQALMRCKSLDELREVQTRFLRTAMDQYSAEATKLMRLGNDMLARSVERRAI